MKKIIVKTYEITMNNLRKWGYPIYDKEAGPR